MSDLLVKPLAERVGRLEKARDSMKPLANTFQFANNCETVAWQRSFWVSAWVHLAFGRWKGLVEVNSASDLT